MNIDDLLFFFKTDCPNIVILEDFPPLSNELKKCIYSNFLCKTTGGNIAKSETCACFLKWAKAKASLCFNLRAQFSILTEVG